MRVLILSQYFWPENFRINEVAESLREAGCHVSILTGQPNYPDGEVFPGYFAWHAGTQWHLDGYEIHRAPIVPRGRGSGVRLALNYLSFVLSASIFGPWLTRGKPFDVVFVYGISPILQGIPATLFRYLKGAAHVIWVQDLWPQSLEATGYVTNRHLLAAIGLLTRWIYRRADLLLVQSEGFVADVRAAAGPGVQVAYHPNPGDRAQLERSAIGADIPPLNLADGFNVVFAGNLGSAQSLETIVAAASILLERHSDIRIIFVGSGSRLSWLQAEIERQNLHNVQIAGRFPSDAMPAIFRQASALLATLGGAPNLSRTVPSKIPSYLASGRPIIACVNGEGARIIREAGAGLTVPAEDAKSLAAAIVTLREMTPEQRTVMAEAGRTYFDEHFSPRKLAHELVGHFQSAMNHRRTLPHGDA